MKSDRLDGLLTVWWAARSRWRTERTEPARLAMRAAWSIAPSHPGESPFDAADIASVLAAATGTHCAPTVLTADIDDENVWRGACLGCGWIATQLADDENPAVEHALDHTHPGWRHLPTLRRSAQRRSTELAELRRLAERSTRRDGLTRPGLPGRLDPDSPPDTFRSHHPALDAISSRKQQTGPVTQILLFGPSRPHAPRGPHPVRTAAGPTSRRQAAPRRTQSGSATFNRAGDDHRRLATALASNERGRWSGRRLGWGVTPGPGRGVWAAIEAQRRAALQSPKPKEILR